MRLSLLLSLSLLLLALPAAGAQSADEFFNHGAQFYISNNIVQAREAVTGGLQLYPDDARLKKLDALLKQQNQSQQNQPDQKNGQSEQDQQSPQQKSGQSDSQPAQNKQPQSRQNQPQEKSSANQSPQKEQPQSPARSSHAEDRKDGQAGALAMHQMTPQEAQQLLDAQKGDEMVLQLKPPGKPDNRERAIKDW